MQASTGILWRASRTPAGIATLAVRPRDGVADVTAWGPGAEWAADQAPRLWGCDDDTDGFDPSLHPVVEGAHRAYPALRLGATDLVLDALVGAIFEQKITGLQAFGGWSRIVRRHGERAPGPTPRPMFAPPERWERIPSWSWHTAGVEPSASATITRAAARRSSLERALSAASSADRDRILQSFRGIGPWTSAEARLRAYGDPDAVSVGDAHLSHEVGMALVGERVDDAAMEELLAPWRGHRQRVIRLIRLHVPERRRGARLHPEDHRAR